MGRPRELSEAEREELLAKGFRPVEIWVIDRDSEDYRREAARQAASAAKADEEDGDIDEWVAQMRGNLWDDLEP